MQEIMFLLLLFLITIHVYTFVFTGVYIKVMSKFLFA